MFKPHKIKREDLIGFVKSKFGPLACGKGDQVELIALAELYDGAIERGEIEQKPNVLPQIRDDSNNALEVLNIVNAHASKNLYLFHGTISYKLSFVMDRLNKRFMSIGEVKHHFPDF